MFAALITSLQRWLSALMKAAASAGVIASGVVLSFFRRSWTSGILRMSTIAALSLATIAGGVFGGAEIAFQVSEMKSGTPASMKVGMSGRSAERCSAETA